MPAVFFYFLPVFQKGDNRGSHNQAEKKFFKKIIGTTNLIAFFPLILYSYYYVWCLNKA